MFKKYQHIERAGSDLVDHILDDNYVIIQPKLDGANPSVWFDNNWNIHCGSRNKELLKLKCTQKIKEVKGELF